MTRKEVKQKLRNFRHVYFIHYDGEGRKKIIYKKIIGLYRVLYIYKYDYSNGTSYLYHREGTCHQEEEFDKNDNRTYYREWSRGRCYQERREYNDDGKIIYYENNNGVRWWYLYDKAGNLIRKKLSTKRWKEYDNKGNRIRDSRYYLWIRYTTKYMIGYKFN